VDVKGLAYFPSPSLAIVNGYYLEQFRRLLRTGEHLNGRRWNDGRPGPSRLH
jgi:hypothetical protein